MMNPPHVNTNIFFNGKNLYNPKGTKEKLVKRAAPFHIFATLCNSWLDGKM
jgi:hypothetical protein